MIYRTGRVIDGPWAKLSFDVFFRRTRGHQVDIKTLLEAVLYAQDVFNESAHIRPEQCDRIGNMLQLLRQSVDDLLDITARLPETLNHLRYPLVRALHEVDKNVSDLVLLVSLFRVNCHTSSVQAITQRREIQHKFGSLIQGCENILQELALLLDKAQYQEQY